MKRPTRLGILALLPAAALLFGCGDDPFQLQWTENPTTATIYSLDREELNTPAAFNMALRARVIVEGAHAEGRWDFALDRQDGRLVLLPPQTLGVTSRAGIVAIPGVGYDEVREAPSDTLQYVTREPVPVEDGTIYVIRTHQQPGQFGRTCHYYGRLEPVEIDVEAGVLVFRHDTSPDCNNRRLVPPGS